MKTSQERGATGRLADTSTRRQDPRIGHPLLNLQHQAGNQAVGRYLSRAFTAEDEEVAEVGHDGGAVSDEVEQQIAQHRGQGSRLDDSTRAEMESAFGVDFSSVRVHAGDAASSLNRRVSARAFTTGSDIFLGPNASPSDTHTLAHELTHVVQQQTMDGGGSMTVGAADDSYEQEADSVAHSVLSGGESAPAQRQWEDVSGVQRIPLVQRCGGTVHAGCGCASDTLQRQDDDQPKPPPLVGQDRAIDPNDKGYGLQGTWDFFGPKKSPKVTGVYGDPPFDAHGDPFKFDWGGGGSDAGTPGPTGMDALCGPGKHWVTDGNKGYCSGGADAPAPQPQIPLPAPAPEDKGDFPAPDPNADQQYA